LLLELATKRHHQEWQKRENELMGKGRSIDSAPYKKVGMFGYFSVKTSYNGYVPSAKYLSHSFKLYVKTIKSHMDREVKKRGAHYLQWDVSYKETKNYVNTKAISFLKALMTATNQLGEVRLQIHIVTDGHDQMMVIVWSANAKHSLY
jgi:hypothetical protein